MYEVLGRSLGGGSKTLPFARKDLDANPPLLIHFTVATDDAAVRSELAQQLVVLLRDVRTLHGNPIVPILTSESVVMTQATLDQLAAQLIPVMKRLLGIPG